MIKNIAVILGDGVGPEIGQQAIKVLDAVGRQFKHSFRFRYGFMGYEAKEKTGEILQQIPYRHVYTVMLF